MTKSKQIFTTTGTGFKGKRQEPTEEQKALGRVRRRIDDILEEKKLERELNFLGEDYEDD